MNYYPNVMYIYIVIELNKDIIIIKNFRSFRNKKLYKKV